MRLANNPAEVDGPNVVRLMGPHNPQNFYFLSWNMAETPEKRAFPSIAKLADSLESVVRKVFVAFREGCVSAANRGLGIPCTDGGDHPKGALEIIARVTHTRSLNPPNQHDAHSQLR